MQGCCKGEMSGPQLHLATCCGLSTGAASVPLLLRGGSYVELALGPPDPPDAREGSIVGKQTWES